MGSNVIAALDLGTNSTLYLLAEVDSERRIHPLEHAVRTNDLGRGLDAEGNLTPETIELNLALLADFSRNARVKGAQEIRIVATEALRRARNAQGLVQRAKQELSLDIRIITGAEEAELTFRGVLSGLEHREQRLLIADVGGGSSEVVLGEAQRLLTSISLPIGAVKLDRECVRNDPPTQRELEAIQQQAQATLAKLSSLDLRDAERLIICGGTASALAATDLGLKSYQPELIAGWRMTTTRLEEHVRRFAACRLAERRSIPGVGWRRAEIILPGAILIRELLRTLQRGAYVTSERGLRYGLLLSN